MAFIRRRRSIAPSSQPSSAQSSPSQSSTGQLVPYQKQPDPSSVLRDDQGRPIYHPPGQPLPTTRGYQRRRWVDENGVIRQSDGTPHKNGRVCGAQRKNQPKGVLCQATPMANGRCRVHGGTSQTGSGAPAFKNGRYTKHLPTRLAERYEASLQDQDLLSLKHEIGILDARMGEILEGISIEETGVLWSKLRETLADAAHDHTETGRDRILKKAQTIVEQGYKDWMTWQEVQSLSESRRKLVDSERARLKDMQQMITTEQAMTLLTSLVFTVRKHVTDQDALRAISYELDKYALLANGSATRPGWEAQ